MPHNSADIKEPAPDQSAPSDKGGVSKASSGFRLAQRIGYRAFRLTGELIAIVLGIAFIWFSSLNIVAAKRTVDISHFSENLGLWFAEAYDGNSADIERIQLSWVASENLIEVHSKNIEIKDADQLTVQFLENSKIAFDFNRLLGGKFETKRAELTGGVLTWYRDAKGVITLGIGGPDSFRTFAPILVSDPEKKQAGTPGFGQLNKLRFNNGTVYVIDDLWESNLTLNQATVTVSRADNVIDFSFEAGVNGHTEEHDQGTFKGAFLISEDLADISGELALENIRPEQVAPKKGAYSALRSIHAQTDFGLSVIRNSQTDERVFDIEMRSGSLETEGFKEAFELVHLNFSQDAMAQAFQVNELLFDGPRIFADATADIQPLEGGSWSVTANAGQLKLDLTHIFDNPFELEDIDFQGHLDPAKRTLQAEKLDIGFGPYRLLSSADIGLNEKGGPTHIKSSGRIEGAFTQKELLDLWPSEFALGARDWIERAIISGNLSNMSFDVDIPESAIQAKMLLDEHVRFEFDATDALVKYISTMIPLENASGHGVLQGNRLDFDLTKGTVGTMVVETGRVEIPRLNPKGGDFTIDVKGHGAVKDMMKLIDQKPFEFASRYGVDPEKFDGTGAIDMRITRPLLVNFDPSRITYDVTGKFDEVKAPFGFAGKTIENGSVELIADRYGMTLSGPVVLGNWKAGLDWKESFSENRGPTQIRLEGLVDRDVLDGFGIGLRGNLGGKASIRIDAEGQGTEIKNAEITGDLTDAELTLGEYWSKAPGVAAQLSAQINQDVKDLIQISGVSLEAPGLNFVGGLDLNDDLQFLALDLPDIHIDGLVSGGLTAKPTSARDRILIDLKGDKLDLSSAVSRAMRAERNELFLPITLSAELNTLSLNPGYHLSPARIRMEHNGVGVESFDLSGSSEGQTMSARLTPHDESSERNLLVHIPDAAKAATAFTGTTNVQSGQVLLTGILPPVGEEGRLTGTFEINDFKLVNAPVFARMLSMASLKGLTDLMGGDGVHFRELTIPYGYENGRLDIDKAKAAGAALGMTGEGYIDLNHQIVDLNGVLVPAYTANSALESIPVIGDIFVGKKGEGIFALSYAVKGPFKQTQIAVNPFSALTPGFLRQIFEPSRAEQKTEKVTSDE